MLPDALDARPLILRRYRLEHGASIAEAVRESGGHLARYETWAHDRFTEEEGRQHAAYWEQAWEAGSAFYFGVWEDGAYLGSAGLGGVDLQHRTADLGYWVRSSATNRGVATAAARALCASGMESLGLQRVEIMIAVTNAESRRVAEKLGAGQEGILRKRQRLEGVPVDCAVYSILAGD